MSMKPIDFRPRFLHESENESLSVSWTLRRTFTKFLWLGACSYEKVVSDSAFVGLRGE